VEKGFAGFGFGAAARSWPWQYPSKLATSDAIVVVHNWVRPPTRSIGIIGESTLASSPPVGRGHPCEPSRSLGYVPGMNHEHRPIFELANIRLCSIERINLWSGMRFKNWAPRLFPSPASAKRLFITRCGRPGPIPTAPVHVSHLAFTQPCRAWPQCQPTPTNPFRRDQPTLSVSNRAYKSSRV